jgi:3-oxoadipate enol-lactonase
MPYAKLPTGRCFYRYHKHPNPDAPLLVLAHSLGTDHTLWERQMPMLKRRFHVLRYDLRGHGDSATPAGPYTVAALGQDALDLLRILSVKRASFCGLSLGGLVGMWLAANAPGMIARLVLCNSAAIIGTQPFWDARIAAVRAGGMPAITEETLARWFTPAFSAAHPEEMDELRRKLENTSAEGYIASCEALRDSDQRAILARINTSTLVISGAHDLATTPADGRYLMENIRGARYVELDAAHLSNIEARAEFNATLEDFLRSG